MSINTISAGQKDWVNVLNSNFTELGKQSETADLVLQNGWVTDPGRANYVRKMPMANGFSLKQIELNMENKSVSAEENFDPIAILPDGFESHMDTPFSGDITVSVDGHFQGNMIFWFATGNKMGAWYNPINGNAGPYDVKLNIQLLYI